MVPAVWIEQTTYRLQGGCSTAELSRHAYRDNRAAPPLQRPAHSHETTKGSRALYNADQ